jgi:hypothetical protein
MPKRKELPEGGETTAPKKPKLEENSPSVDDVLHEINNLTEGELQPIVGSTTDNKKDWEEQVALFSTYMSADNQEATPETLGYLKQYFSSLKVKSSNISDSNLFEKFKTILTRLEEIIDRKITQLNENNAEATRHTPNILDDLANICQLHDKCSSASLWEDAEIDTYLSIVSEKINWEKYISFPIDTSLSEEEKNENIKEKMKSNNVSFSLVYLLEKGTLSGVQLIFREENDKLITLQNLNVVEPINMEKMDFSQEIIHQMADACDPANELMSNFYDSILQWMHSVAQGVDRTYFLTENKELIYINNASYQYFSLNDEQYTALCQYIKKGQEPLLSLEEKSAIREILGWAPPSTLFVTSNNLGESTKIGNNQQETIIKYILVYLDTLQKISLSPTPANDNDTSTLEDARTMIALISASGDVNSRHDRQWGQFPSELKKEIIQKLLSTDSFSHEELELYVSKLIPQNPDARTSFLAFLSSALRVTNSLRRVEKAITDKTFSFTNPTLAREGGEGEHAEMRQLVILLKKGFFTDDRYKDKTIYLGISKACCLNCHLFLQAVQEITKEEGYSAGKINYSGQTHSIYFRDYPSDNKEAKWRFPSGFISEQDSGQDFLNDMELEYAPPESNESVPATNKKRIQPPRNAKQNPQYVEQKSEKSLEDIFTEKVVRHYKGSSAQARKTYYEKKKSKAQISEPYFLRNKHNNLTKLANGLKYFRDFMEVNLNRDRISMNMDSPPVIEQRTEDFINLTNDLESLNQAKNDAPSRFETFMSNIVDARSTVLHSVRLHRKKLAPPVQDIQQATSQQWLTKTDASAAPELKNDVFRIESKLNGEPDEVTITINYDQLKLNDAQAKKFQETLIECLVKNTKCIERSVIFEKNEDRDQGKMIALDFSSEKTAKKAIESFWENFLPFNYKHIPDEKGDYHYVYLDSSLQKNCQPIIDGDDGKSSLDYKKFTYAEGNENHQMQIAFSTKAAAEQFQRQLLETIFRRDPTKIEEAQRTVSP